MQQTDPGTTQTQTAEQQKKRRGRSDMTKIEQIRRRKHEKRLRAAVGMVLVLAVVLAYLGGLLAPSINFFSNLLDSAKIALLPGDGFPAALDSTGVLNVQALSGGAALLDASDLVLYSPTAKELRRIPHGYADPAIAVGGARTVLYNRGSTELRVESRTRTLMTKTTDYEIITAGIADNGTFAVVTKAERYNAEITVYNASFDEIYYCYLAEDTPLSVAFSESGKRFAAVCLHVAGGSFGTQIHLYDTTKSEQVGQISTNALPLELYYLNESSLLVICDSYAAVYDAATGAEQARYDYNGAQLLCADRWRKNIVLCFGDANRTAVNRALVLDSNMQPLLSLPLGYEVRDVLLQSDTLTVLSADTAVAYDLTGAEKSRTALETEGEFLVRANKPLVVTAKEILQLSD